MDKSILQGTGKGTRRRKTMRLEDKIKDWTGVEFIFPMFISSKDCRHLEKIQEEEQYDKYSLFVFRVHLFDAFLYYKDDNINSIIFRNIPLLDLNFSCC